MRQRYAAGDDFTIIISVEGVYYTRDSANGERQCGERDAIVVCTAAARNTRRTKRFTEDVDVLGAAVESRLASTAT